MCEIDVIKGERIVSPMRKTMKENLEYAINHREEIKFDLAMAFNPPVKTKGLKCLGLVNTKNGFLGANWHTIVEKILENDKFIIKCACGLLLDNTNLKYEIAQDSGCSENFHCIDCKEAFYELNQNGDYIIDEEKINRMRKEILENKKTLPVL